MPPTISQPGNRSSKAKAPKAIRSIEVFASGKHPDSSVPDQYFSPAQVAAWAKAYNSQRGYRAPATKGHPRPGDQAYGYVERFTTYDDPTQLDEQGLPIRKLVADFVDISPKFFEAIRKGRYRERSLGLKNGRIDHVAWLGAELPAVKGLAPVQFQEDSPGDEYTTINFTAKAGGSSMTAEDIKKAIQDGLTPITERLGKLEKAFRSQQRKAGEADGEKGKGEKKFSQADADGDTDVDAGDDGTQDDPNYRPSKAGAGKAGQVGSAQFSQLQKQVQAMAQHNAALQGQVLDAQFSAWLESPHVKARVLPAERENVLGMMKHLATQPGQIEFAEGEALSTLQAFQKTIWDRPAQVVTGEFSQATNVAMYGPGITGTFAQGAGNDDATLLAIAEQGASFVNPVQPNYQGS